MPRPALSDQDPWRCRWCKQDEAMSWQGSTRRSRLPSDWNARRAKVKDRATGKCEGISIQGEPRWHVAECDGIGTDCDHDKRGDDHSLENLRWLSEPCHKHKTQAEKPARLRRDRRHPGG